MDIKMDAELQIKIINFLEQLVDRENYTLSSFYNEMVQEEADIAKKLLEEFYSLYPELK